MGLKESEQTNNKRWSHPPKKKWIHCYMAVGEEKRPEASELKSGLVVRGNSAPHAVSFTQSHVTSTVCPLDRKGGLLSPSDDRHSLPYRRRAHQHHHHPYSPSPSPSTNGSDSPHHPPTFALASPILTSPSSSSPLESTLGIVSTFKGEVTDSQHISSRRGLTIETTLGHVPVETASGRVNPNGFLRPNGLTKPLSPLSRDYEDQYCKDEAKKRAGTTPSREVHNKLEKNRRAHMKECFEALRRQLPCLEDKKISNQTILKAAYRCIQNLKRKEKDFSNEMERLARQKIAHQQQIASLKKELLAKWEHIDFAAIMPDMASLEQNREKETKSTTTASEQPDFEDDSRDSSGHSNSLTITSSPEARSSGYSSHHPVDLTPSSANSDLSYAPSAAAREPSYQDPNQPLNLSTNTFDVQHIRIPSPVRSPQQRVNGEWPMRRGTHFATSPYSTDDKCVNKPIIGRVHTPGNTTVHMTKISSANSNSFPGNILRNPLSTSSTNTSHISPVTAKPVNVSFSHISTPSVSNANGAPISHFVKSATSHVPPIAKVVTTIPNLTTVPQTGATVARIPHSVVGSNGQIHAITSSPLVQETSSVQAIPTAVSIANLTPVSNLSNGGSTVARVSSAPVPNTSGSACVNVASQEHATLPIIGGNGIQLPAHLVTSSVHLSGAPGTILSQPAIQVITPEGYKLLPAEHAQNGAKPLAITLTHSGLEHLSSGEDGKTGPVMVAVSKNGLSALHLALPQSARALSTQPGASGSTAVKVTQTGSTSILPSYLPLTHANGITQLVQGMSLVGPLVVSQSQRGIMVPATGPGGKGVKPQGVTANGGTNVPLVPAQYASTIAGGLVNSVVVVSAAPAVVGQSGQSTASVVTSTVGAQSVKH